MKRGKPAAIALLGLGLLLPSSYAFADESERGSSSFIASPLSSLLPGLGNQTSGLGESNLVPSKFSLGFFTPGQESGKGGAAYSAFYQLAQPDTSPMIGLAAIDHDQYYGFGRLETNRFSRAPEVVDSSAESRTLPRLDNPAGENLTLNLEAGVRKDNLSAGLLYAYQSGYPDPSAASFGTSAYPAYIFAPSLNEASSNADLSGAEGHAVFMYLGYNLSQQLKLRGTFGVARTNGGQEAANPALSEQSRRWGLDFAATYKILDNLVYEAHLGYVSLDDGSNIPALDGQEHGEAGNSLSAVPGERDDAAYHIGSHIRMTF